MLIIIVDARAIDFNRQTCAQESLAEMVGKWERLVDTGSIPGYLPRGFLSQLTQGSPNPSSLIAKLNRNIVLFLILYNKAFLYSDYSLSYKFQSEMTS